MYLVYFFEMLHISLLYGSNSCLSILCYPLPWFGSISTVLLGNGAICCVFIHFIDKLLTFVSFPIDYLALLMFVLINSCFSKNMLISWAIYRNVTHFSWKDDACCIIWPFYGHNDQFLVIKHKLYLCLKRVLAPIRQTFISLGLFKKFYVETLSNSLTIWSKTKTLLPCLTTSIVKIRDFRNKWETKLCFAHESSIHMKKF